MRWWVARSEGDDATDVNIFLFHTCSWPPIPYLHRCERGSLTTRYKVTDAISDNLAPCHQPEMSRVEESQNKPITWGGWTVGTLGTFGTLAPCFIVPKVPGSKASLLQVQGPLSRHRLGMPSSARPAGLASARAGSATLRSARVNSSDRLTLRWIRRQGLSCADASTRHGRPDRPHSRDDVRLSPQRLPSRPDATRPRPPRRARSGRGR